MGRPRPHPLPPEDFADRPLRFIRVPKTQMWFRFHNPGHQPVFFGITGENRFDDPVRQFGVLYVARNLEGAFVERFLRDPGPYQRDLNLEMLDRPLLSIISADRSLKLVDLAGKGLAQMGLDNRLGSGDYALAQQWSAAFYHHPKGPDGIQYPSRHNPKQLCAAFFDRVVGTLNVETVGTLRDYLGDSQFYSLLQQYHVGAI